MIEDNKNYKFYYGYKECLRLGIHYIPESIEHSNMKIKIQDNYFTLEELGMESWRNKRD